MSSLRIRCPQDTAVSWGHRVLRIPAVCWGYRGVLEIPRYPEDTSGVLGIPYPEDTPACPGDTAVSWRYQWCPEDRKLIAVPPIVPFRTFVHAQAAEKETSLL